MYQTFFKTIFLSVFVSTLCFADDFLAKLTDNALSDTSLGVKKLSIDEASKVVGGYLWYAYEFNRNAINKNSELTFVFGPTEYEIQVDALCGIDQATCSNASQRRLVDWLHIVNGAPEFHPTYIVKRQVHTSAQGNRYVVFSYQVGALYPKTGQLYRFDSGTSSALLNNNMVIKEIVGKYKETMESLMGGWNPNTY